MLNRYKLAAIALSFWSHPANAQTFDEIVVFGDSHSDIGNFCKLLPNDSDCVGLRASNGPLWIEQFASQLDVTPADASLDGGLNFAFGGARTGAGSDSFNGIQIPRLGEQIEQYLASHTPTNNQLFILFAGHNDWNWNVNVNASVPLANISAQITDLANAGVNHLLVPNLSPLGHVPFYRGGQSESSINEAISEYNLGLANVLPELSETLATNIVPVDFASLVQQAIDNPSDFGLSNVTGKGNGRRVTNPDEYLYWDNFHFTTAFHGVLASEAIASIPEPSGATIALYCFLALMVFRCRN